VGLPVSPTAPQSLFKMIAAATKLTEDEKLRMAFAINALSLKEFNQLSTAFIKSTIKKKDKSLNDFRNIVNKHVPKAEPPKAEPPKAEPPKRRAANPVGPVFFTGLEEPEPDYTFTQPPAQYRTARQLAQQEEEKEYVLKNRLEEQQKEQQRLVEEQQRTQETLEQQQREKERLFQQEQTVQKEKTEEELRTKELILQLKLKEQQEELQRVTEEQRRTQELLLQQQQRAEQQEKEEAQNEVYKNLRQVEQQEKAQKQATAEQLERENLLLQQQEAEQQQKASISIEQARQRQQDAETLPVTLNNPQAESRGEEGPEYPPGWAGLVFADIFGYERETEAPKLTPSGQAEAPPKTAGEILQENTDYYLTFPHKITEGSIVTNILAKYLPKISTKNGKLTPDFRKKLSTYITDVYKKITGIFTPMQLIDKKDFLKYIHVIMEAVILRQYFRYPKIRIDYPELVAEFERLNFITALDNYAIKNLGPKLTPLIKKLIVNKIEMVEDPKTKLKIEKSTKREMFIGYQQKLAQLLGAVQK